jgi:hypothetical protein
MLITPKSALQRMRMIPDLGTIGAPDYAHAHNRKNPLSSSCAFRTVRSNLLMTANLKLDECGATTDDNDNEDGEETDKKFSQKVA